LDAYVSYIQARWKEGCHNASLLFREIREQGYPGTSYTAVRDLVQNWRGSEPLPRPIGPRPLAATRQSAWLLTLSDDKRSPEQQRYVAALQEVWPQARELERVAREFIDFFQKKDASTIGLWIQAAERTPLRRFALGLFSDLRAIRAVIELPWSNGPTEGHINRLKTIKRSMYGRAGFDLLRARLLSAS
jgi:transposase